MAPTIIKSVETPKQDFKTGEVLFRENEGSNGFYLIKKGTVAVYKNHGKSDQVLLATIEAGRVLGEISAFDGLTRSATAVAQGPVEAVRVNAETLAYQMKQCPPWFRAIILDLVERLRRTDELLIKQGVANANAVSSGKANAEVEAVKGQ